MASTYTSSLRFDKQGVGDNDSTWGLTLNTNFDLLDAAIAGAASISVSSGNTRLGITNGGTDTSRVATLIVVGAPSGACSVVAPAVPKQYIVQNNTTGGQKITMACSGGSGVVIPANTAMVVYCDGTSVRAGGTPVNYAGSPVFASVAASTGVFNGVVATSISANELRVTTASIGTTYTDTLFVTNAVAALTVTSFTATTVSASVLNATRLTATSVNTSVVNAVVATIGQLNAVSASLTGANIGTLYINGSPYLQRVVQVTIAQSNGATSINSSFDGTTNTQGALLAQVTLTPTTITSTFIIEAVTQITPATNDKLGIAALFTSQSATVLANAYGYAARNNIAGSSIPLKWSYVPATTGQVVVSLRGGATQNNAIYNGYYPGTNIGHTYLQVTEVIK